MEEFDVSLLTFKGLPMMSVRKNQVVFNPQAVKLINAEYVRIFHNDNKLIIQPANNGIPFNAGSKGEVTILARPFLKWLNEKGFGRGRYILTKTEEGFMASL